TLESFLRGHVEAFAALQGVPRTILYDNLKSVVLERVGDHIRFHPHVLELAGHYHFAPQPCAVARGNEKGRVERFIGFLRHAFFAPSRPSRPRTPCACSTAPPRSLATRAAMSAASGSKTTRTSPISSPPSATPTISGAAIASGTPARTPRPSSRPSPSAAIR